MPPRNRSKDPLRPRAEADPDAEIDQALRDLGDELLKQEIPDRLLRVLRAAAEAADEAKHDEPEPPPKRSKD